MREEVARAIRWSAPPALLSAGLRPGAPRWQRVGAAAGMVGLWTAVYAKYRQKGKRRTAWEYERLAEMPVEAFKLHYDESVPTIEEEFELWGRYHQHRHEMRYDLVAAAVRRELGPGGSVLDVGCGACLVADRIADLPATYVGLDYPHSHMVYARERFAERDDKLELQFVRGDGEGMPFRDATFDVVVMSEVIEHLMRPELAVWEISRVLRPGGVFVMTTNNASEVPLRSPLSHLMAWLEKGIGAYRPELISYRPWIWPWPVDKSVLPAGSPNYYVPHSHHIFGQTRDLFAAAGLDTFHFSTFEFPPPQAQLAKFLDRRGEAGRKVVDVIEAVCQRMPMLNKMGCHLLMVARKQREAVSATPPPEVWPGPWSNGREPVRLEPPVPAPSPA